MSNLDHRLRILLTDTVSRASGFDETLEFATGVESAAVAPSLRRPRRGPFVDFLARCSTQAATRHMGNAGAEILAVVPGKTPVVVGRAQIRTFDELASIRGVERIEMARPIDSDLDLSRVDAQVDALHIPPQCGDSPIRGEGAVVGVIDTGIDYTHPKFRNADGTSRILFLWEQGDTGGPGAPVDLGHGQLDGCEYSKADIDVALATNSPLQHVPHEDVNGHGSHVAGIAAGNGRGGLNFRGVAPDADLIVVASMSKAQTLGKSTNSLLAYQYIIARAGDQPVVINQSQGMNGGGHFGDTVLETGIDSLLRDPGVVAVKSAGNEQQWRIHAGGTVAQGDIVTIDFQVPQSVRATVFIEIWFNDTNELGVAVQPPGEAVLAEVLASADVAPEVISTAAQNDVITVFDRDMDDTGETQVTLAVSRGAASLIRPGTWQIRLRGAVVVDGRYDIWIERASRRPPARQARFTAVSAENNRNISIPGTARRIITVGSYATRPAQAALPTGGISEFSSRGPARLGVQKPEITAPGESIISARSSSCSRPANPDVLHTALPGTSMAAPHVAGAVALILSEHPNSTADQVKQILMRSARVDSNSSSAPDETWGNGKLDVSAAVSLAATAEFAEISDVQINAGHLIVNTDVPTTVTVAFHRSIRQLLLGKTEGTRSHLIFAKEHDLNFSDLPTGKYLCAITVFTSEAFWTFDDNAGAGYEVRQASSLS